jgi:hypothetical protein
VVREDGFFRGDTITGEGIFVGIADGKSKTTIPFK